MTGRGLAEEICIWKDKSECKDCDLHEKLFCRPKSKYMLYFGLPALAAMVPAGIGLLFSSEIILGKGESRKTSSKSLVLTPDESM